jgi:hypothetical protein
MEYEGKGGVDFVKKILFLHHYLINKGIETFRNGKVFREFYKRL